MNTRFSMGSGALIAALTTSTASFADVTPQEVWGLWHDQFANYGYDVTMTESMSGDTLTISGLSAIITLPEDDGTVTVTLGDLGFKDLGDGTVQIVWPAVMPINFTFEGDETVEGTVNYSTTELSMIASGATDDMTVTFSASEIGMSLARLIVEGNDASGAAQMSMTLGNVAGDTTFKTGNLRMQSQNMTAGTLGYDIAVVDPEGSGSFLMKGQTVDLNMASTTSLPLEMDMQDINAALKAGFGMDLAMTTGAGSSTFSFNDDGDNASGNSSSTGTRLALAMNEDALSYGLSSTGLAVSVMGSDIPMPINLTMAEVGFDLTMPISKADTPQEFSSLIKVVDLAPEEMIWGMFDPTGALPHDPATLIIDVAGSMSWLFDIMDPEQQMAMADVDMPALLHTLDLKDLTVSFAGAELTGVGGFTFNNDDLETFDGLPAPDGSVDLKLVGANGLMDSLVAMGMLDESDVMGARMMMGLFGRPGEGEDTTLSTIEIKSDGQILANGQRLQ